MWVSGIITSFSTDFFSTEEEQLQADVNEILSSRAYTERDAEDLEEGNDESLTTDFFQTLCVCVCVFYLLFF